MKSKKFSLIFLILSIPSFSYLKIDKNAIKYGTRKEKIQLIEKILNAGSKVYLPELNELLSDEDEEVRSKASYTLFKIGDSSCIDFYRKALSDPYWQVRLYGIKGLVKYGEADVIYDFVKALSDSYWQVRYYAATGLGKYGNENSVKILISHLTDKNIKVKEEILWALNRLMWRNEAKHQFKSLSDNEIKVVFDLLKNSTPFIKIRVLWLLEATGDKRAIPYFIKMLQDSDDEVKIRALWALEKFKAEESGDEIEALLGEESVKVKIESIKTLVRLKSEEGIEGLVRGLYDKDINVRIYSLWALERFKNPGTYPEIVKCLSDPSDEVREYAINVIENLKDPLFVPILKNFIEDKEVGVESKTIALNLLGKIGDEDIKDFLKEKVKDENSLIRYASINAYFNLDKFDKNYIEILNFLENNDPSQRVRKKSSFLLSEIGRQLVGKMKSQDEKEREFALERIEYFIGTKELRKILLSMFKNPYPEVRERFAFILKEKIDKIFSKNLRGLLKESDIEMKKLAAIGLGEMRDKEAIPLLKKGLKHFDPEYQLICAWSLAKMGIKDGFPIAVRYIESGNIEFQKKSIEILAFLNDKKSSNLLLKLMEKSELEVKVVIAWALSRMGEEKGLRVLVRLSETNVEPVRTIANEYLSDPSIPYRLKSKIPYLRDRLAMEKLGVQEVKRKYITAYKITSPIEVDGNDNERFWQIIKKENKFILISDDNVASDIQTKVAAGYDEKNIYFLIICEDPESTSLNYNSRDFITISINPFNLYDKWYQFVVHPYGLIKYTYVWKFYSDDEPERLWNSKWKVKTKVESDRWIVEISIPLRNLKVEKISSDSKWDINFLRYSERLPVSTWTGRIDNPEQFGVMIFREKL